MLLFTHLNQTRARWTAILAAFPNKNAFECVQLSDALCKYKHAHERLAEAKHKTRHSNEPYSPQGSASNGGSNRDSCDASNGIPHTEPLTTPQSNQLRFEINPIIAAGSAVSVLSPSERRNALTTHLQGNIPLNMSDSHTNIDSHNSSSNNDSLEVQPTQTKISSHVPIWTSTMVLFI